MRKGTFTHSSAGTRSCTGTRSLAIVLMFVVAGIALVAPGASAQETEVPGGCVIPKERPPEELFWKRPPGPEALTKAATDFWIDMPDVIDQGSGMSSCQCWAVGYYAYGFLKGEELGWDVKVPEHEFSAMMLYWLCTRGEEDEHGNSLGWPIGQDPTDPPPGTSSYSAMTWMTAKGICSVAQWGDLWPYKFKRPATTADQIHASHYRTADRSVLFFNEESAPTPFDNDIVLVKDRLLARSPVVVALAWWNVANPGELSGPNFMYEYGSFSSEKAHAHFAWSGSTMPTPVSAPSNSSTL